MLKWLQNLWRSAPLTTNTLPNKTLSIENWSHLEYVSSVYKISPTTDGRFMACVNLFLHKPQMEVPKDNECIIIPLGGCVFNTAIDVAAYLYLMGPVFHNTSDRAGEVDKEGNILKFWKLDSSLLSGILKLEPTDAEKNKDLIVKPTHNGSDTVN